MKTSGFTLAEVLVTLGIIGVVAALAMPALNSSVQKTKVGPSLRKFMNAIENADRIVMQQGNADDLQDLLDETCNESRQTGGEDCTATDGGELIY